MNVTLAAATHFATCRRCGALVMGTPNAHRNLLVAPKGVRTPGPGAPCAHDLPTEYTPMVNGLVAVGTDADPKPLAQAADWQRARLGL